VLKLIRNGADELSGDRLTKDAPVPGCGSVTRSSNDGGDAREPFQVFGDGYVEAAKTVGSAAARELEQRCFLVFKRAAGQGSTHSGGVIERWCA
jgi:hypothetical protein